MRCDVASRVSPAEWPLIRDLYDKFLINKIHSISTDAGNQNIMRFEEVHGKSKPKGNVVLSDAHLSCG